MDDELLQATQSPDEWHACVALDYVLRRDNRAVLEQIDWMSFPNHRLQHELVSQYLVQKEGLFENLPQFPRPYFLPRLKEDHMLSMLEKTIILKGTDLFEGIPGEDLFHIAQVMEEERLNPGDVLFREGDRGDYLFIIVTGEVRMHHGGEERRQQVKGEYFGHLALFDGRPRSLSAAAVDETLLLKINQENFGDVMMNRAEVMRGFLKNQSELIRTLDNEKESLTDEVERLTSQVEALQARAE